MVACFRLVAAAGGLSAARWSVDNGLSVGVHVKAAGCSDNFGGG